MSFSGFSMFRIHYRENGNFNLQLDLDLATACGWLLVPLLYENLMQCKFKSALVICNKRNASKFCLKTCIGLSTHLQILILLLCRV